MPSKTFVEEDYATSKKKPSKKKDMKNYKDVVDYADLYKQPVSSWQMIPDEPYNYDKTPKTKPSAGQAVVLPDTTVVEQPVVNSAPTTPAVAPITTAKKPSATQSVAWAPPSGLIADAARWVKFNPPKKATDYDLPIDTEKEGRKLTYGGEQTDRGARTFKRMIDPAQLEAAVAQINQMPGVAELEDYISRLDSSRSELAQKYGLDTKPEEGIDPGAWVGPMGVLLDAWYGNKGYSNMGKATFGGPSKKDKLQDLMRQYEQEIRIAQGKQADLKQNYLKMLLGDVEKTDRGITLNVGGEYKEGASGGQERDDTLAWMRFQAGQEKIQEDRAERAKREEQRQLEQYEKLFAKPVNSRPPVDWANEYVNALNDLKEILGNEGLDAFSGPNKGRIETAHKILIQGENAKNMGGVIRAEDIKFVAAMIPKLSSLNDLRNQAAMGGIQGFLSQLDMIGDRINKSKGLQLKVIQAKKNPIWSEQAQIAYDFVPDYTPWGGKPVPEPKTAMGKGAAAVGETYQGFVEEGVGGAVEAGKRAYQKYFGGDKGATPAEAAPKGETPEQKEDLRKKAIEALRKK